jgi:urease accessory protein
MLSQRTEILRDGKPVWFERLHVPGGSPLGTAAYALAGKPTLGTMIYIGRSAENVTERVRSAVGDASGTVFSVSRLEQAVVCRYLGPKVSEGKALFIRAWDLLRTAGQGKPASAPRIWAT